MRDIKIILICMLVAMVPWACSHDDDDSARNIFYSEAKSVNKLVLAQMRVSKMATVDDLSLDEAEGMRQTVAALTDALKIGSRKAAYSYNTYLRAYIDMSSLSPDDVEVDEAARTVTLRLPPVMTEFQGRDASIREEHYRVTGLRSGIDAHERAAIKEQMNTALKHEVEERSAFRERLPPRPVARPMRISARCSGPTVGR